MGIAERKQRQKEEVRASILRAAWNLVEQEGWQALSIRKIADAIEYSAPVIYDHFQNKEGILLEFTRRGFQLLNTRIQEASAKPATPEERLAAIANAYAAFAFSHTEYYQLMYGLGMPSCETVKQIPELSLFTDLVMAPIKELIAGNPASCSDAWLKLHTFWSMLHGLISINMMGKEKGPGDHQEAVMQDFLQSFIRGLKG
ncbi:transcriptional regulator, TetR family [Cnuella takakiae]|uniref:Transcriptional regulator, TetR family n=1 Tax=Cnuella takakiae TaxID=1302690 RepID=A0A1M4XYL8_9BACT|nr:TetR/AcrR family transcriptional regulator [Cnuella takakiae]OLY92985.1 TetR family transcriptional regulator [Cnuella takakiae]SHE98403.1 transcriptional regulator, TetR family [Cnuella takakiae]